MTSRNFVPNFLFSSLLAVLVLQLVPKNDFIKTIYFYSPQTSIEQNIQFNQLYLYAQFIRKSTYFYSFLSVQIKCKYATWAYNSVHNYFFTMFEKTIFLPIHTILQSPIWHTLN